jgi:hypothetical protein
MYGSENISDEQIMSGLKVMNWNFRKQNPDTANIVSAFKPIAADCEIEFHLAHLDPNGNCTSGINRIASPLTTIGDHSVKSLIHWDPSKYLNIYIVQKIQNLAGHCLMPDAAAAKPEWDGIVASNDYIGDTGTSSSLKSVVLAHEAGHYLNLFHIWGGNNVPGYYYLPVGQTTNCGVGDDVADTPPTIGWSTCNLAAASCGNTVDMVQNAMDYSYCNFVFTQGQRQRMRAALNDTLAHRNNLWTAQNLINTGVDISTLCKSAFTASRNTACVGDTLFFTDKSISTPTSWLWNFGDGNTSTERNPYYVFYAPGTYYVKLTASKGNTTLISDSLMVRINDAASANPYFVQDFENINSFAASQLMNNTDNANLLFSLSGNLQGYNSNRAAVIRMDDTTATYSGRSGMISPALDLTTVTAPALSFKFAFSQKVINGNDKMEVFLSNDCGKTWTIKVRKIGVSFRTVSTAQTDKNWVPQDSLEWQAVSLAIPAQYTGSGFMFKIEFTNYQGNAFYIDNININPAAYNSLQKVELQDVQLMPNPASGNIMLDGLPEPMHIELTDITGRTCIANRMVENNEPIDINMLAPGVYHISLQGTNSFCVKRFIKY